MRLKDKIRVSTIDNYQGEEANIILISLVRNFGLSQEVLKRHTIGFLKTSNRINVLLSRARYGMYLMGSASLLSACSPMWKDVINIIKETGTVDNCININCPKHPNDIRKIEDPNLFPVFSPDGGCLLPCDMKLRTCGHQVIHPN
jgi:superfamily I DNA and/or RNA helicase